MGEVRKVLLERPKFNKIIRSDAGIGYVAILVLLATLSTMGLTFMYKVGLMSSVALNRRTSMQAHYLAESAANRALWRLLNDPGFAPESDKYYMHSMGGGRYGYKVRKPTETTFATVATVGATENNLVNQSYVQYIIPSNVFTAYGNSVNALPIYRRLIGAQWTDPADIPTGATPSVHWTELEGCPIRKEIVVGVLDNNDNITLAVWDGASWGNSHTFTANAEMNYKCFDIAYESQSGNALVVGRTDATTTVRYNVWDGTAWAHATAQPAFNLASGALRLVTMASCPGNDDILIATVSWNHELQLFRWDGAAFTDLGVIEGSTGTDKHGVAQIVYEQQSGDALILWAARGTVRYRVWNGVALGPENTVSGFDWDVFFLRAAADPASDTIVLGGIDKFYDITVAVWDGTAWTDSREVWTDNATNTEQGIDIAWEASGEDALVVWAPWSGNPRYLAWKKGTALADITIQQGPNFQGTSWLIRLQPIYQSEKIVLLVENTSNDLRYSLWDGDRLKGDPGILLEPDIPVQNQVAFDLAEAEVPRSGGTGSGIVTNQPPTVDAGLDETIYLPINQVELDGTVTDDGLPNPPATVTTTWSVVSGPGTVNFDDDSLVDTVARFTEAGLYVLRLTADDSELSDFDEVTIIVDSCALLLVVADAAGLTTGETARKTMLEGWGWTVSLISDHATQGEFDTAAATVNVAYISATIDGTILSTKLRDTTIGVVIEKMMTGFGIASDWLGKSRDEINIIDNSHYITSPFDVGLLTYLSSLQPVTLIGSGPAPGLNILAETLNTGSLWKPSLVVIDTGGGLSGGGNAAGRRVQLPWGDATFDFNALNSNGKTIMRRAVEWAADKEGGCGGIVTCNADYVPNTKVGEFSTSAYGSNYPEGLAYIPFGKSFYGQTAPDGGALISVDMGSDMFYFTDLAGNPITSLTTGSGTHTGVTLVQTGTWANHLAVSDKFADEIKYFDLSGNFISSFSTDVSAEFNSATPEDVAFIGDTASGTYNYHLAIPDPGRNKIFLVDQNGVWVSSIDISTIVTSVMGAVHIPQTDKLLLVNSDGQAFIVDLAGNLWNQYDTPSFGTGSAKAITINTITCDHLISDPSNDLVLMLNLGGAGDTDPPTPDPMTWASPPAADGPNSVRMTATAASDPSSVEYYFECTAGGGNDSGWQDSATYADTGLSPTSSYTYRVKARDRSVNYNETGWSAEASATTPSSEIFVYDITMGFRKHATKYFGQATVWIRTVSGENVSGAVVGGDWSGDVSGTSMGSTASDGKVMLESADKKNGGTFTFTVTSVVKTGYTYNSSLNVEDSDTIIAP
jgi:hypothetical protein